MAARPFKLLRVYSLFILLTSKQITPCGCPLKVDSNDNQSLAAWPYISSRVKSFVYGSQAISNGQSSLVIISGWVLPE